jgi:hypothetical protein
VRPGRRLVYSDLVIMVRLGRAVSAFRLASRPLRKPNLPLICNFAINKMIMSYRFQRARDASPSSTAGPLPTLVFWHEIPLSAARQKSNQDIDFTRMSGVWRAILETSKRVFPLSTAERAPAHDDPTLPRGVACHPDRAADVARVPLARVSKCNAICRRAGF